jgi:hypothetical protein
MINPTHTARRFVIMIGVESVPGVEQLLALCTSDPKPIRNII